MKNFIVIISIIFFLFSCSKKKVQTITKIEGEDLEQQMIIAYEIALDALEKGDVLFATKKFNEVELLFPQSEWAPKASLMSAYAYWCQSYYKNSVEELKRFLEIYPKHPNLDYAYYLLAMNYYDSILDEKKDLRPLKESKYYFEFIIKEYPETDYALDARYKLELIQETLAAKEIYIARHYIKKKKWIAALNRLKTIISDYNTTIFVDEALHRLVEVNYIIGLEEEAEKYAKILGYNYQSSDWYEKSYKIFNQDYEKFKKEKKKIERKDILDKIKSFL